MIKFFSVLTPKHKDKSKQYEQNKHNYVLNKVLSD